MAIFGAINIVLWNSAHV